MKTKELLFLLLVLLSIISAWLLGVFKENTAISQILTEIMPEAQQFEKAPSDVYIGLVEDGNQVLPVGYVGFGSATCRSGPIEVAAGFNSAGWITSIALVKPVNTAEVSRQAVNDLLMGFVGMHYSDRMEAGHLAEIAPAVRRVWQGLSDAVGGACQNVARVQGQVVEAGYQQRHWFGLPEMVLVLLYVLGYVAYKQPKERIGIWQWMAWIGSLLLLGFWLKSPMSLEYINALLIGYWPSWQTHLYWYLLIGGVLVPMVLTGKSFYCHHVCPFGATQKILGVLGPFKVSVPQRVEQWLRWLQRGLVWVAVLCALVVRNPAVVRYEVSGTLFGRDGLTWQLALLAVILVASLVITRPWCNYLCPIRAVFDFFQLFRRAVFGVTGKTRSPGCAGTSAL